MQRIKMRGDLLKKIAEGKKTATTRLGLKDYKTGPVEFYDPEKPEEVLQGFTIFTVKCVPFIESWDFWSYEDYESCGDLKEALEEIYGDIHHAHPMTVAFFSRTDPYAGVPTDKIR